MQPSDKPKLSLVCDVEKPESQIGYIRLPPNLSADRLKGNDICTIICLDNFTPQIWITFFNKIYPTLKTDYGRDLKSGLVWSSNVRKEAELQMVWISNGI